MASSIQDCPVIVVAHVLGKKWSIPVIEEISLSKGDAQFNTLKRSLKGITARNLSESLSTLREEGIIKRRSVMVNNVGYARYNLTKKGTSVKKVIDGLKELGIAWYGINPNCKNIKCSSCTYLTNVSR